MSTVIERKIEEFDVRLTVIEKKLKIKRKAEESVEELVEEN